MEEFRDALDVIAPADPSQSARVLVRVIDDGAIPTTVPKVFHAKPSNMAADDTEGASYSTAESDTVLPVVVLGPKIPVAGDLIVAHGVGGRWVSGDGGAAIPTGDCGSTCTACGGVLLHYSDASITDSTGTHTLTWNATNSWYESAILSVSTANGLLFHDCGAPFFDCKGDVQSGTIPYLYHVQCSGTQVNVSLVTRAWTADNGDCARTIPTPAATAGFFLNSNGAGHCAEAITATPASVFNIIGVTPTCGATNVTGTATFVPQSFSGKPLPTPIASASFSFKLATGSPRCLPGCDLPITDGMVITFPIAGAIPLAFSTPGVGLPRWTGSFTASGHAYVVTILNSGTIDITRDGGSCFLGAQPLPITSCPPSFTASIALPAGGICKTELGGPAVVTE